MAPHDTYTPGRLMNRDFVYTPDELVVDVEDLCFYEPGGYHPIILGNVIRSPSGASSYRILHKLGYGAFSTVWIADHNRSDTTPTYVAVKVSIADNESAKEAELLQSVPSPHIIPVFDSFELDGPNGRHHVVVTEVLCSFVDFLNIPRPVRAMKRLVWEITKAVEQLHEAGLIHGDLHLRNVGVTLPQIQTMRITKLTCALEDPVMTPVILRDMTMSNTSVPTYITAPSTGLKYLYPKGDADDLTFHAKLFDFGSVRKENDSTKALRCICISRSPELVYATKVERRNPLSERPSDIWALGTLIFQIVSGGEPMFPDGVVLSKITAIAGDPPLHWDQSVVKSKPDTNTDTWWSSARSHLRERLESLMDDFVYTPDVLDVDVQVEDLRHYKPGGYHPIILGDVIRSPTDTSSYRILHKLGHGTYSTVWLADHNRSDTTPTYVAVKVSTADGESANEADLLRSVPSSHIVPVFDSFELAGPNGQHHVIVTEALMSFVDLLSVPRPVQTTKRLVWEIVKAVEQLHEAGLVHGDLHLRNVGVTLPQIQTMKISKLTCELENPVVIPIFMTEMGKSTTSVPTYITVPCSTLKSIYKNGGKGASKLHAKLFDFGSVRKENDSTKELCCIRISRSPELVYATEVDGDEDPLIERPTDIWALGTVIFQIVSGGRPMFPRGLALSDITHIAGDPPIHWDQSVFKSQPDTNTDTWWSRARSQLRKHCESDADCDTLIRLLRRIFVLDAAARPSAADILCDEWFASVHGADEIMDVIKPQPDQLSTALKEVTLSDAHAT
ncbi:hypothetical protein D9619_013598 [Psilocybe cf. subviscida]|uniref:Protein kinase domain-containing protein n=1 Tax=Psilocybe cf. subviscida TaxID=2480587 RepID=A0A8H5EQM7_9AGAR|nr:hypothetical protein D9619_013598 [Psilocybe cf. subviscida]